MSVDEFVEQGTGGRSRGGCGAAVAGVVMFLASFPVLWWNEGRAVRRAKQLEELQKTAIHVETDTVNPVNEGKTVHVNGEAVPHGIVEDAEFGLRFEDELIKLRRIVEMYQWKETKKTRSHGSGRDRRTETVYKYSRVWSDKLIDSSQFRESGGHENPTEKPFASRTFTVDKVTLGAFILPDLVVGKIQTGQPLDQKTLEATSPPGRAKLTRISGMYYRGANPSSPAVGDVRIKFEKIPATTISLIAQQVGDTFGKYATEQGTGIEYRDGTHSLDAMIKMAQEENRMMTWIIRIVGVALSVIGLAMVFSPLTMLARWIPFIGEFVGGVVGFAAFLVAALIGGALSLVTIGAAWVFYRPVLGVALLGGAAALIIGGIMARKAMAQPKPADHLPELQEAK
jgi:hypothetical protein